MFYVWFDDLNLWRLRVFSGRSRADDLAGPEPASSEPVRL
jgi:hypothetical protein